MHESGTGGTPKYGVVAQLPVVGEVGNPLQLKFPFRVKHDEGGVGWYRTTLESGVVVNLAATEHVGVFEYEFPETAGENANVLVDVSHFLKGDGDYKQGYQGGNITLGEDGSYEGTGTYFGGWNLGKSVESGLKSWRIWRPLRSLS